MSKFNDEALHIHTLLNEPGAPTDFGCASDELNEMIEKCRSINEHSYYCAVTDWFIWDIQVPENFEVQSVMLVYANTIIDDEAGRFPTGGWVRSTAVKSINDNCIFSTRNTHYILVGPGTRKSVSVKDVYKVF